MKKGIVNIDLITNWKDELKRLKLANIKKKSPGFYDLSGGDRMKVKKYDDRTTNGLTTCIIDFLCFSGWYANRIQSQGQVRIEKIQLAHGRTLEKVRWTKSQTNKGTPDIDSIINRIPVKIEVKCDATRDTQSDEQKGEQALIEQAGGVYLIAGNMAQFLAWYYDFISQSKSKRHAAA